MISALIRTLSQTKLFSRLMEKYPKIRNPFYLNFYIRKINYVKNLEDFDKLLGFTDVFSNLIDFLFLGKGVIYTQQVKSEIVALLNLLKEKKAKTMLEIGTAGGGSLFLFSRVMADDATIISLDLPGGIHGGGYPEWKSRLYKVSMKEAQDLHLIRDNSHDLTSLEKVKKILDGEKLDFLFIDGDHTYNGVKIDFELYNTLVKKDGLIALHDIVVHPERMNCHVNELWNELKKKYRHKTFVENWNQQWAGIGVLFK